jgi:hypothetical protein
MASRLLRPHMIFQTNDNRAGLSLIVASKVSTNASDLTTFMGALSGSTSDGKPFQRHCIVIKDTEAPTEAILGEPQRVSAAVSPEDRRRNMIEQTGLFTLKTLAVRHRLAIDHLAKTMPVPIFDDQKRGTKQEPSKTKASGDEAIRYVARPTRATANKQSLTAFENAMSAARAAPFNVMGLMRLCWSA